VAITGGEASSVEEDPRGKDHGRDKRGGKQAQGCSSRCKEVFMQDIRRIWIGKASRSKGGAI
jgi:hypothetical protein